MRRPLPAGALVAAVVTVVALAAVPLTAGRTLLGVTVGPKPAVQTVEPPVSETAALAAERDANRQSAAERVSRSSARAKVTRPHTRPAIAAAPGMASSCPMTRAFPEKVASGTVVKRVEKIWKVRLTGSAWAASSNREVLKTMWQTLDAVDCTPFLTTIARKNKGAVTISGEKSGSWAWGDYGYSRPEAVSLSLAKMADGIEHGERPRVVRVMVHELAHAWSTDRGMATGYWGAIEG